MARLRGFGPHIHRLRVGHEPRLKRAVCMMLRRFGARPETDPWPHALLAAYPPARTALPDLARNLPVEYGHGELARLADLAETPEGKGV